MAEKKGSSPEEPLDFDVIIKILELSEALLSNNLDVALSTTDIILARFTIVNEVVLFVRSLEKVRTELKRWPDEFIEKINKKLAELSPEVVRYAQIAESLGIEYQVEYGEFWQEAANQKPFPDIPESLEYSGKTSLHILRQWLYNTKNYLDHNAELLSPEESSDIKRIVIKEVLEYLLPELYPDIEMSEDTSEEDQEELDDIYMVLEEKSRLIKEINRAIEEVKKLLPAREDSEDELTQEQSGRNKTLTIQEVSREIEKYGNDLQIVVANLKAYRSEELHLILADLEREKALLLSLGDLGFSELSTSLNEGVKKDPRLVSVKERGIEAVREHFSETSDQFPDDLEFLAELLLESGVELEAIESVSPLITHAVTLTDTAYSNNYMTGLLKGSAFAADFSHMSTLVKLGEYMRNAMRSVQKKMPLPNMTTTFYVRLPISDSFLILFDDESLNTVNPDIFSYTSQELGRKDLSEDGPENAVLAELVSNSLSEGKELAIARLSKEGKLVIMEPKKNMEKSTDQAKARLNNVRVELRDIPQMIEEGFERYG